MTTESTRVAGNTRSCANTGAGGSVGDTTMHPFATKPCRAKYRVPRKGRHPVRARSRGGGVEHQSHHDGIPQLAVAPSIVTPEIALLDETELVVQPPGGHVVGPQLQGHLVEALGAGPVDRRRHQRRSHPAVAPGMVDRHADLADSPTGGQEQVPDRQPTRDGHHGGGGIPVLEKVLKKLAALGLPVDGQLPPDPDAFGRHRLEQVAPPVNVPLSGRSHDNLRRFHARTVGHPPDFQGLAARVGPLRRERLGCR